MWEIHHITSLEKKKIITVLYGKKEKETFSMMFNSNSIT